jgi:hypothetical protein
MVYTTSSSSVSTGHRFGSAFKTTVGPTWIPRRGSRPAALLIVYSSTMTAKRRELIGYNRAVRGRKLLHDNG